jgi:predicted DNA-binding transcriptional regulator AlpA
MENDELVMLVRNILDILKHMDKRFSSPIKGIPLEEEKWLDALEMQQQFHISRSTLYRLKKEGQLRPSRLGKKDYYAFSEVVKILRNLN